MKTLLISILVVAGNHNAVGNAVNDIFWPRSDLVIDSANILTNNAYAEEIEPSEERISWEENTTSWNGRRDRVQRNRHK
mgnify:CR=1 FL=1